MVNDMFESENIHTKYQIGYDSKFKVVNDKNSPISVVKNIWNAWNIWVWDTKNYSHTKHKDKQKPKLQWNQNHYKYN